MRTYLSRHCRPLALVAALAVALSIALQTPRAQAYAVDGHRFQNGWSIHYELGSLTSYDKTAFLNGISDWNGTPAPIYFVQSSSYPLAYLYDENDGNNGYIGYENDAASTFDCQNGYTEIQTAYAWLNTNYTNGMKNDIPSIESTAGHELGHALGLDHVNNHALMYPTEDRYSLWGIYKPQTDDISGATYIYNQAC